MNRANRPRLSRISGSSYASKLLGRAGDGSTLTLDFTTGQLDPRLTFTRGSNATFINSSGLVEYAASNQQIYSQDQSQSGTWVRQDLNGVDANVGATTDPQGGNTASKLRSAATLQAHLIYSTISTSISSGLAYTFSVYVKKAELKYVALHLASTARYTVVFDLDTGLMTTTNSTGTPLGTAYSSQDAGNGWWRLSATMITQTTTIYPHICLSNAANPGTNASGQPYYTGVLNDGVYTWGAQLNAGSTPLQYIATTTAQKFDQPRFDYDPTTLAPRGLLIEATATNVALNSETFPTSGTGQWGYSEITANVTKIVGPDNTTNAIQFNETTNNALHRISQGMPALAAGAASISVWAKVLNTGTPRRLFLNANSYIGAGALFDLDPAVQTGSSGSAVAVSGTAVNRAGTWVKYPNDWYRCTVVGTYATAASIFLQINRSTSTTATDDTFAGSTSNGLSLWGVQVESGSGASSYIPTGASTVQRLADNCYIYDTTTTGGLSWFKTATQGTFYVEMFKRSAGTAFAAAGYGTRGTSTQDFMLYQAVGNNWLSFNWGASENIVNYTALSSPFLIKSAAALSPRVGTPTTADVLQSINGTAGTLNTSPNVTLPFTSDLFCIGSRGAAAGTAPSQNYAETAIRRIKFFPFAMTAAQMNAMTTL